MPYTLKDLDDFINFLDGNKPDPKEPADITLLIQMTKDGLGLTDDDEFPMDPYMLQELIKMSGTTFPMQQMIQFFYTNYLEDYYDVHNAIEKLIGSGVSMDSDATGNPD